MKKHRILMASTIVLNIGLSPLSVAAAPKVNLVQMTEASEAADAIRAPREWANPVPVLHDLSEEVEERLPIEDEWTEDEWQDEASSATAYQTEAVGREGDQSGVWGMIQWSYEASTGTLDLGEGQSGVFSAGSTLNARPWAIVGLANVRKLVVHVTIRLPVDSSSYFRHMHNLEEIVNSGNLDMSRVTNMSSMFYNAYALNELDVSSWDTSQVTSMYALFYGCWALTSLDLSNWDTSRVRSLAHMFNGSRSMTSLDLSSFDTSRVTSMDRMFTGCHSLISLNVGSFDTSSVTSMTSLFNSCRSLINLDISNFDTSKVTTMVSMFSNATGLTSLDLSSFDTSSVTTMASMFSGATGLTSLDLSSFDTSSVTTMANMFSGATGLADLGINNFDTSKVTTMVSMFSNATELTNLDLSHFDTSSVTTMANMFSGATGLADLDISNFDTSKVTTMVSMFSNATGLTSLDLSSFDTSSVTTMANMFSGATGLTNVDVSSFDTPSVTTMVNMFSGTTGLTSLDLSSFDTSSVTTMESMFAGATGLTSLDLSSFDTSSVRTMESMFASASGLINLDLSHFNTRTVTRMANMFAGASALEKLNLSSFEMSYTANTRLNLLENTTKLATLIIGERTNLNSTNLPPVPDTDGYVGLWMYENLSSFFTSSQLMSQGANSLAGRYIWAASGGEVTVRHEDVLGNTLAPTQTITGYIEQTYEATIQSILGWSFVEADGPLSGIFTQDKQEITLIYELADAKIHDPINPAAEIHPAHLPDTAEELKSLRIDFAPTLNFGVGTISTTDQAYYAEPLQLAEEQNERPNFVQISHFHPEQPGWRLSLQQKEQMMTSQGEALTGAVIEFTQGNLVSVHNRTRPSEYLSDFQLVPGKSTQLIKAEANQGMGTWLYPFGDTATQDQSIQLHVPAKTNPRAQTYEAILTWSLEIVP